MDIAAVREQVRQDCSRSENVFGPAFFEEHLVVVAEYAGRLAEILRADREVVELAAYLHDLAAVRDAANIADHARLGADLARGLLLERGWTAEVADAVARCCASHSAPLQSGPPEEVCVSNADAIAQIIRPAYWSWVVFGLRRQRFQDGREWLLRRWQANWDGLAAPAKELAEEQYRRVRGVFD